MPKLVHPISHYFGKSYRSKSNHPNARVAIPYKWDGYIWDDMKEEDIPKWSAEDCMPQFMKDRHLILEDLKLDTIRRLFFIKLKGAKDYQRDYYLPKAMMMLRFINRREMIPLREQAIWLGMPKTYLETLVKRDIGFRRLVFRWRFETYNKAMKAERARMALLGGGKSILEIVQPHWNTSEMSGAGPLSNGRKPIDVGWRPKAMSRKR